MNIKEIEKVLYGLLQDNIIGYEVGKEHPVSNSMINSGHRLDFIYFSKRNRVPLGEAIPNYFKSLEQNILLANEGDAWIELTSVFLCIILEKRTSTKKNCETNEDLDLISKLCTLHSQIFSNNTRSKWIPRINILILDALLNASNDNDPHNCYIKVTSLGSIVNIINDYYAFFSLPTSEYLTNNVINISTSTKN